MRREVEAMLKWARRVVRSVKEDEWLAYRFNEGEKTPEGLRLFLRKEDVFSALEAGGPWKAFGFARSHEIQTPDGNLLFRVTGDAIETEGRKLRLMPGDLVLLVYRDGVPFLLHVRDNRLQGVVRIPTYAPEGRDGVHFLLLAGQGKHSFVRTEHVKMKEI